ncbi:MAG: endonuclease/exonuclease/phosphatase family protein [Christensenella sp.]|nr:endonuclease/exonuclease/phosphatase family protein [Christensenella sp.]
MKKAIKIIGITFAAFFLLIASYAAYLLVTYDRIADMQELSIIQPQDITESAPASLQLGEEYSAATYNIGFGAYTPEYSFFMDGGKSSWAASKESVLNTVEGASSLIAALDPDFALIQEIDLDATRSYHIDQYELLRKAMPDYYSTFAVNYDSAFLAYPFTEPHGKSKSGLALFSRFPIAGSMRRSFPISTSITKFFDLDRCYSVSRFPVENGKELVILTLHMSAYGNSDEIREGQILMLCEDMEREYFAGNYVICGGDFNHDLKALADDNMERESWVYPFPREKLPEHFEFCIDMLCGEERAQLWNSARNADMEYVPDLTYTVTLDGFIISDNIKCTAYENINTGYCYSDHDPVLLRFQLLD